MKNPSSAICEAKHGNKRALWEVEKTCFSNRAGDLPSLRLVKFRSGKNQRETQIARFQVLTSRGPYLHLARLVVIFEKFNHYPHLIF